uniref:NB-ARC domain-containing protein n=1 Tax=Oryza brachyantha TaxID=4533 RepID=J3L1A6_ORYBR
MAEGVVGLLIGKLGAALGKEAATNGASLLCQEASALKALFAQIRDVKDELESMEAFLHGAERFKDIDETTGIYVRKIRLLAFEIEDAVDEFTYKLEDKHGGFAAKTKKRIKHLRTWRRLARRLQDIKRRLENADRRKLRYDLSLGGIGNDGGSSGRSKSPEQSFQFAREEDLVGIEKNREVLMQWMVGDSGRGCRVATVWGMGGVGKTTLVSHVFKTVRLGFDVSGLVTVTNSYQLDDLLKKISGELEVPIDDDTTSVASLVERIHNHLQGKRYILVLDDVWHPDVWFKIRNVFPTESTGRFIFTTRMQEVALLATKNCTIELAPLDVHCSWQLFCKEAFWNTENRTCPEELEDIAWMFVEKCAGLPIAIACIGRLLSCKHPTYSEWQDVYKELELQLTNNVILDVNIVLKVSLEDLQRNLKNCFLHCTIFPEGYVFNRKRLIRHWIAAGYIQEIGSKTVEEVAEGYLNELVNKSLLQVVKRNLCGRVRWCRMHDIICLLALAKSKEECFCEVYKGSEACSIENTRRLSIQNASIEHISGSSAPCLRSLHFFNSHLRTDSLKAFLISFNFLSTLDLQGISIKRLPKIVFDLFNLRFLGLRQTDIEYLPKELGRLQNLEVLDAYNSKLSILPVEVATLRKLKYLYVVRVSKESFDRVLAFGGIQVPLGICNLIDLLALQFIEATTEILCQIGCLTKLTTFSIGKVRTEHCADLCDAIMVTHLVHLTIGSADEKEVIQLETLCLPSTISNIELIGQLSEKSISRLNSASSHLRLKLCFSKLNEDSSACLLNLHNLVELHLLKAYDGKELTFSATSFPKLKLLSVQDAPNLRKIAIQHGALQNLVELFIEDCSELRDVPDGIEHVRTLEYIKLKCSDELRRKLQIKGKSKECNEDTMKISHVKWVEIV